MARLFWLSDEAWARIEPHLPHGQPGKPRVDDRRVISGILHVLKVGCRWQDLMRPVRIVAAALADGGTLEATQHEAVVDIRDVRGPVRLRLRSLHGYRNSYAA